MKPYKHKVQYYETDMMGITHHANIIRWMEEARIDLMDQIGYPYTRLEAEGVSVPVKSVSCNYIHSSTFGDEISIETRLDSFNGVVMEISYEMQNQNQEIICTARSEHVFLNRKGHFVRLKRDMPEFCSVLAAAMNPEPTDLK